MRKLQLLKSLTLSAAINLLALVPAWSAEAGSSADPASIVKPTLLADTTAVQPGGKLMLGVLFKVQPGWHIYWENPGASGFATTVKWALPEGLSAKDEVQYPVPISFESPGNIISYGYEHEVLLITEATVEKTLPESGEVEINAKTRWLMCSDRCIPGKQDLSLKLPIGKGEPANAEVFGRWLKELPKKSAAAPQGVKVAKSGEAGKTKFEVTITPTAGKKVIGEDVLPGARKAYFFPAVQEGFVISAPVPGEAMESVTLGGKPVKVHAGPATITFDAEVGSQGAANPALKGVLVYQEATTAGAAGPVRAFSLNLK